MTQTCGHPKAQKRLMWNRDPAHSQGGFWKTHCIACHRLDAVRCYWKRALDTYWTRPTQVVVPHPDRDVPSSACGHPDAEKRLRRNGSGNWVRRCVECHRLEERLRYWKRMSVQPERADDLDLYFASPERVAYEHQRAAA